MTKEVFKLYIFISKVDGIWITNGVELVALWIKLKILKPFVAFYNFGQDFRKILVEFPVIARINTLPANARWTISKCKKYVQGIWNKGKVWKKFC